MKISTIKYKTIAEVDAMKRFDMKRPPYRTRWYLRPVSWLLSLPETLACKLKVVKENMDDLRNNPYLLLCNHSSFVDFKVATMALFPRPANYVVAIDGYINLEFLLRRVGGICKRKFVNDVTLVKQLYYSLTKNKTIALMYPEARYSMVGTNSELPESLGKMIKMFKMPVATLIQKGNHLRQPFWNFLNKRKVPIEAKLKQILTKQEIADKTVDEINETINKEFVYDDYKYQYENKIKIDFKDRAKGLNKVLYQCPHCKTEFQMNSDGNRLWCENCHKVYEMDEYGRLKATEGETEFEHIPDWYNWEREQVRREVESGNYHIEAEVNVDSLPNSVGHWRLGLGKLVHDWNGFYMTVTDKEGKTLELRRGVLENYSVHTEFAYHGKGDCVILSTHNDTYYIFPTNAKDIQTKITFATEEMYKIKIREKAKETP